MLKVFHLALVAIEPRKVVSSECLEVVNNIDELMQQLSGFISLVYTDRVGALLFALPSLPGKSGSSKKRNPREVAV